jgi:hypothetical protein
LIKYYADAMLMVKILALELAGNYFREVLYHQWMHQQNLSFERVCELVPEYPFPPLAPLPPLTLSPLCISNSFKLIETFKVPSQRANNFK